MPRNSILLPFLEFQKLMLIQTIVLFLFKAVNSYLPATPNLTSFVAFYISFCMLAFLFRPSKILLFYLLDISIFVSFFFLCYYFQLSYNWICTDWFLTMLPSENIESNMFSFQFNSYGFLTQCKEFGEASFLNGCSALLLCPCKEPEGVFSNYHHPSFPYHLQK